MCGIHGQFNYERHAPISLREIQKMARSMVHRRPADERYDDSGPFRLRLK